MRIKVRYQDLTDISKEIATELDNYKANITSLKDIIKNNTSNAWTGIAATAFKSSVEDEFVPYLNNIYQDLDYYNKYIKKTISKYEKLDDF